MDKIREAEPYMGVVRVSRSNGTANLFDSDVEHHQFIELEISQANITRDLSQNWIHGGRQLISVWMSEVQWAHLLSSLNQGEGVPVTLKHVDGQRIAPPPRPTPDTHIFKKEVKEKVTDSLKALESASAMLKAVLVPNAKVPTKGELKGILSDLETAMREFSENVPFVEQQFAEHLEKKVGEAKIEFNAYTNNSLRSLGLTTAVERQLSAKAPRPQLQTTIVEDANDDAGQE